MQQEISESSIPNFHVPELPFQPHVLKTLLSFSIPVTNSAAALQALQSISLLDYPQFCHFAEQRDPLAFVPLVSFMLSRGTWWMPQHLQTSPGATTMLPAAQHHD